MRIRIVLPFVALLCVAADEAPKGDLAKMQGVWFMVKAEMGGKSASWLDEEEPKLVLKGNKLEAPLGTNAYSTFGGEGKGERPVLKQILKQAAIGAEMVKEPRPEKEPTVTITLDPSVKPKHIDVNVEGVPGNRKLTFSGIYMFDGDTLRVCMGARPGQRPTEFKSDTTALATLVREKEWKALQQKRFKAMQEELKKLKGTWEVAEGRFDGTPLTDKDRQGFQLVFDGNQATWKEAGSAEKLSVKLDPAGKPHAFIDLLPVAKDYKGGRLPAVYLLEGDKLVLRIPYQSSARPRNVSFEKEENFGARDARLVLTRKK